MRTVAVVVIVLSCGIAAAQPGPDLAPPGLVEPPPQPHDQKEPGVGLLLSTLGAVAPIVIYVSTSDDNGGNNRVGGIELATVALLFAPSAGHWYAGSFWTPGLGLRAAGIGLAGVAILAAVRNDEGDGDSSGAMLLLAGGITLAAVGALYDIAEARDAVVGWNRAHTLHLQPTMMRTGQGYGVGFAGRF